MLTLLAKAKENISWQSTIYRVPWGVIAWAVRVGTNTLATPDNLAGWGVKVDVKCPMEGCIYTATLGHILRNSSMCIERSKFWHDSCLNYIVNKLVERKPKELTVCPPKESNTAGIECTLGQCQGDRACQEEESWEIWEARIGHQREVAGSGLLSSRVGSQRSDQCQKFWGADHAH